MFSTVAALTSLTVLKHLPVSLKQPFFKTVHAVGPSPTQPSCSSLSQGAGGTKGPTAAPDRLLKLSGVSLVSASGPVFTVHVYLLPGSIKPF